MNITELCVKCNQNNSCTMCWKTSNKKCPHFIQKTNADRIRAMSDEELVDKFGWHCLCDFVEIKTTDSCDAKGSCKNCLLEWLKQPAEV